MKRYVKRALSLIIALVILVSSTISVLADGILSGDAINANLLQKIEFSYFSAADSESVCYYTSDYFSNSSYVYNHSLATMSLSLAFSAFASSDGDENDYTRRSSNAKKLLSDIGVPEDRIAINEAFTVKPTTDSIGVIAGSMPIFVNNENYTLVAVAVRGAGYEQEWASNFTIGTENQHQGFSEAKNKVLTFLKDYFETRDISGNVKLWITGYSRAAAVANLVAGAIDDGEILDDDVSYEPDDVYTYTFETPAGALTVDVDGEDKYNNIFNIINPNDPVPFVAPVEMGFDRYGIDVIIPTAETDPEIYEALKENMLKYYYSFEGTTTYTVDEFQMKKLGLKNWLPGGQPIEFIVDDTKNNYSQNVFLSKYIEIVSNDFFVDRQTFVDHYQTEIREICSVMFGCTYEQQTILLNSFIEQAKANWGALAWSYVWNAGINPWGEEADAFKMVADWMKKALNDAGITDYDEAVVDSAAISLADLMLALVTSHPNYFSTVVMNADKLMQAHYPELCLAWMQSLDKNYNANAEYTLNNNAYRTVYVNGETDVLVYNENKELVASIVNEAIVENSTYNYNYGFDDEDKYVILPVDKNFEVVLENVKDALTYTVKEYDSSVGFTRIVEYSGVSAVENEVFTGTVPSYSEDEIKNGAPAGSGVVYTLVSSLNREIDVPTDISRNSEFSINAMSSNDAFGTVIGTGTYKYGDVARLTAKTNADYVFKGWYEGDTLYSVESEIEIQVYRTRNFKALFACPKLTPIPESGIVVTDNFVYGLQEKTESEDALKLFEDSENVTVSTEAYIGTGEAFYYYGETYYVVLKGDVDGDGEISSTDYLKIKSYFIGIIDLEAINKQAADVDDDGMITATDYLRIKSYFLGDYTFSL